MNVWLITIGEALPLKEDIKKERTLLLAEKLLERGHNVLYWASAFDHYQKKFIFKEDTTLFLKENFSIKILKGIGYQKNFSFKRFIDQRIIAKKFKKKAKKEKKPDIIVVSFPPYDLAYEAVFFAKRKKIPVVVDIRDKWPDIFLEFFPFWSKKFLKKLLFFEYKKVKFVFKNTDFLVSMMRDLLDWGLSLGERKASLYDKVFYLGAQKPKKIEEIERFSYLKNLLEEKFVVFFVGNFNEIYNPLILVKTAKDLLSFNIHFVLAGDGIFFEQVKKESQNLKNITLVGWLSKKEIDWFLFNSSVGIICSTKEIEAFPNKAFLYFSGGLPVISSCGGELKKIIEKYNVGRYYQPNNSEALKEKIIEFYKNKNLYQETKKNVLYVFEKLFDAENIYRDYTFYLEKIKEIWKKEN